MIEDDEQPFTPRPSLCVDGFGLCEDSLCSFILVGEVCVESVESVESVGATLTLIFKEDIRGRVMPNNMMARVEKVCMIIITFNNNN